RPSKRRSRPPPAPPPVEGCSSGRASFIDASASLKRDDTCSGRTLSGPNEETVPQPSVLSPDPLQPAPRWRLEVLGQYWANISVQSRRHVALPGRSLEFGRRFFRSFPPSLGGFDSLPRPSCDRAGDGSHDLGSWGWIARDHFNDPWRCGAN